MNRVLRVLNCWPPLTFQFLPFKCPFWHFFNFEGVILGPLTCPKINFPSKTLNTGNFLSGGGRWWWRVSSSLFWKSDFWLRFNCCFRKLMLRASVPQECDWRQHPVLFTLWIQLPVWDCYVYNWRRVRRKLRSARHNLRRARRKWQTMLKHENPLKCLQFWGQYLEKRPVFIPGIYKTYPPKYPLFSELFDNFTQKLTSQPRNLPKEHGQGSNADEFHGFWGIYDARV